MTKAIKIQCPAKINLALKITGKRPDGFHNIESIMQTINLFDYINIKIDKADSDNSIILSGNNEEIPYNQNNLVYKAANLFIDKINLKEKYKINIFIEKNIPVSAGLAGGTTDAAGTLFGLNKLYNCPLSRSELHQLCSELGSDLNFCLEGGTQKASGRGEILEPLLFEKCTISLIKPISIGISAREAYQKFSEKYSKGQANRNDYVNDLEWAVIDDYKELQKIKKLYPNSIMSGSGSTYYIKNSTFDEIEGYWVKNDLQTIRDGVKEI